MQRASVGWASTNAVPREAALWPTRCSTDEPSAVCRPAVQPRARLSLALRRRKGAALGLEPATFRFSTGSSDRSDKPEILDYLFCSCLPRPCPSEAVSTGRRGRIQLEGLSPGSPSADSVRGPVDRSSGSRPCVAAFPRDAVCRVHPRLRRWRVEASVDRAPVRLRVSGGWRIGGCLDGMRLGGPLEGDLELASGRWGLDKIGEMPRPGRHGRAPWATCGFKGNLR